MLFPPDEERLAGRFRKALLDYKRKAKSTAADWLASTIAARWPGK